MARHLLVCLMVAVFLLALPVLAQEAPPPAAAAPEKLPTLDEVLDRYLQASGGADAIQKLNSCLISGTFETQGNAMPVEMGFKASDKFYFTLKMGDMVVYSQFSNGTQGWTIDNQNGEQPMPDDQRAITSAMIDVRLPVRIRDHFPKLSLKGKGKSEGRDAWLVEAETKSGTPISLYFDAETGLLIETDATANTPNGSFQIQNFVEDYRDVDGVKTAFSMRQTGANDWTLKVADLKYNVDIPDSKFEKTAGAPAAPTPK
jgi:zinc protease